MSGVVFNIFRVVVVCCLSCVKGVEICKVELFVSFLFYCCVKWFVVIDNVKVNIIRKVIVVVENRVSCVVNFVGGII